MDKICTQLLKWAVKGSLALKEKLPYKSFGDNLTMRQKARNKFIHISRKIMFFWLDVSLKMCKKLENFMEKELTSIQDIIDMYENGRDNMPCVNHPDWYDYIHSIMIHEMEKHVSDTKLRGKGELCDGGGQMINYTADISWEIEKIGEMFRMKIKSRETDPYSGFDENKDDENVIPEDEQCEEHEVNFKLYKGYYPFFDSYSTSEYSYKMVFEQSPFPYEAYETSKTNLFTMLDNPQRITDETHFESHFYVRHYS